MKPKTKTERDAQKVRDRDVRRTIMGAIKGLENQYGQRAVSGAFSRHTQARRERSKLEAQQRETAAKLAKLDA